MKNPVLELQKTTRNKNANGPESGGSSMVSSVFGDANSSLSIFC